MTATPESAVPVVTVTQGLAVRATGSARTWVQRGCHRCLRTAAGHPAVSMVTGGAGFPLLSTDARWWAVGTATAVVTAAVAPWGSGARRAELPSVGTVAKRRWQLARVRRTWRKAVGVNGNLHVVHRAEDVHGSPLRAPGHKEMPRLLRHDLRRFGRYRPRMTPVGWVVYADGNNIGAVPQAFQAEVDHMRGTWKARNVIVAPDERDPAITKLSIVFDDPFKGKVLPSSLPAAEEPLGCVDGIDVNGDPVEGSHWLPTLVVGRKGSGKSRWVRRRLQSLCESGQPFKLFVFDPKGNGQEFGWLRDAAWVYESDRMGWAGFLQRVHDAMYEQASRLSKAGKSECPVGDVEFPLLYVVVDELVLALALTTDSDKILVGGVKMTVKDALKDYLTQNRSAGSTMVACTQMIQKEVLGPIRGLFDWTVCLAVNDRETAQIATGDAKVYPAHQIPKGRAFAGRGYAATDDGVVYMKVAFVSDEESAAVADRVRYWTDYYRVKEPA